MTLPRDELIAKETTLPFVLLSCLRLNGDVAKKCFFLSLNGSRLKTFCFASVVCLFLAPRVEDEIGVDLRIDFNLFVEAEFE